MKHSYIIILFSLLIGCDNKPSKSDLHYPVEKVQDVMIDLYVASEAVKDVSDIEKDSLLDVYKSQIEKIHNIEFDIIENDIALVRSNDGLYTDVHKVVNDSINRMEREFQKIPSPKINKTIPDKKPKRKPKAKKQMK